jgi:hypothetical protein
MKIIKRISIVAGLTILSLMAGVFVMLMGMAIAGINNPVLQNVVGYVWLVATYVIAPVFNFKEYIGDSFPLVVSIQFFYVWIWFEIISFTYRTIQKHKILKPRTNENQNQN